ncbi:site-specific integrase [Aestuariivita sp.]|uniref:tyrosine-type recombinase/integrase n=1 Tax=Aestuariivita sp. TaxID=1872407 RepID=UPI0021721C1B|nr:site-specific integrase [Aestuariivita sp.]MCE8006010.1 integrase arm-type DNA-binding domain-containing protein [Aestuariivita sp.]
MTNINALSHLKIKSLGPGKHFDGQGLMLVKSRKEAGKWMLRLIVAGKRREMGLGRWPDVSLSEARERASDARRQLRDGVDPIQARQVALRREQRLTVADAIERCFVARQAELKNDGRAGRWLSPLSVHVIPKIGTMAVEDIDQHVLKKTLEPIWHEKADTARKAMNRMNLTLKHAAALGLDVDLQAVMKAQALLGKRRHQTKHIPSLPYREAPSFYRWLSAQSFPSAYALRFLMLTVARTSEVRFAVPDEIEDNVWTLDPKRTKTATAHRVPLSPEALRVIDTRPVIVGSDYLFPSPRGKAMSDATMSRLMEREEMEARPHGFRATFRTWVEETTDTPFEVKETALGHQVGSEVERAYQRSDLLEKRRVLLEQWADFLTGK